MSLRQVTVGVVGSGKLTHELACDALNQHFSFGPEDSEGYFAKSTEFEVHLIFPVGQIRWTDGIHAVWQWALRTESAFLAITDGTEFPADEAVRDSIFDPDDWQESATPEHTLLAILKRSLNPMLLVITEDGAYSAFLKELAAKALTAGIPVYDLGRGLLEQGWEDLGVDPDEDEEQGEDEPAPQPPARVLADGEIAVAEETVREVAETLADGYALVTELHRVASGVEALRPALTRAERALNQALTALPAPAPASTPAGAPARDGAADTHQDRQADGPADTPAPGAPSGDGAESTSGRDRAMRTEVFDEETGQWKPAGRGRPKQGVKTRRVPK